MAFMSQSWFADTMKIKYNSVTSLYFFAFPNIVNSKINV